MFEEVAGTSIPVSPPNARQTVWQRLSGLETCRLLEVLAGTRRDGGSGS